jgi:hypothetical protein
MESNKDAETDLRTDTDFLVFWATNSAFFRTDARNDSGSLHFCTALQSAQPHGVIVAEAAFLTSSRNTTSKSVNAHRKTATRIADLFPKLLGARKGVRNLFRSGGDQ